jgi:hypothetical protein
MADEIIAARVRELLNYDPETGIFTRKVRTAQRHQVGDRADFLVTSGGAKGYYRLTFDSQRFLAHRVAWLYINGAWPEFDIDHKNGRKHDNRICNLRDIPNRINRQNIQGPRSDNKASGVLGVTLHQGRWRSRIQIDGKAVELGSFDTKDGAHEAYLIGKRALHEGCTI